jgi:hypothetical protein
MRDLPFAFDPSEADALSNKNCHLTIRYAAGVDFQTAGFNS